jgi:hypothetical protein
MFVIVTSKMINDLDRVVALITLLLFTLVLMFSPAQALERMDCFGTEPFWDALLTDARISFKRADSSSIVYSRPKYTAATNAPFATSVQAKGATGNLIGFVVGSRLLMSPSIWHIVPMECQTGAITLAFT